MPSTSQGPTFPADQTFGVWTLSGKVVIDDGTTLSDSAIIQSVCQGRTRVEGQTDSKGEFFLNLTNSTSSIPTTVDASDDSGSSLGGSSSRSGRRDLRNCTLQALIAGFSSQGIQLQSRNMNDFGNADVGTIVLHRLGGVEGFTISATSAGAPAEARKEYEKGRDLAQKKKWDGAISHLAKAVSVYPKYAVAWCEPGLAQMQMEDVPAAKHSFQEALVADSKFINPHGELTYLAVKEKDWKSVANNTEKLLALNPVNYPQFWFYNSAANYFLGRMDAAGRSAARCITLDPSHQLPCAEYLLGMVLMDKKDYAGAAARLRNYVRLAPKAPDIELAQKQLAEMETSAQLQTKPQ